MLKELLQLMDNGKAHTLDELARRMDVSEATLSAALEYLQGTGNIQKISNCNAKSGGCHGCNGCDTMKAPPTMWVKKC